MSTDASQAEDTDPRPALAGRRVLVVDGDESIRAELPNMVERMLNKAAGAVASAASASSRHG